jgi:cytochrome c nitrite reductase small subunit
VSRILIVCVLVGVSAGLGSYTFHYAAGTSYFSSNPAACVNCHIMREQYDGWQKASHHAVASCNDCHTPHALIPKYLVKAENGFWHSKAFTLQDFHEPIRIRPRNALVLNGACIHCHQDLVSEVVGHGTRGNETLNCVHCHASVGHGAQR